MGISWRVGSWPPRTTNSIISDVFEVTTRAVAAPAGGSIVTPGRFATVGADRFQAGAVVKSRPDGAVDAGFGNAGSQLVHFEQQPNKDEVIGLFPSSGNTLLVAGYVESMTQPYARPALLRLLANGALDTSFGTGGKVIIDTQPFGIAADFDFRGAIQAPDGKILPVGSCSECGHGSFGDFMALRVNANGTVDSGFGNEGWVGFGRTDAQDHYVPEVATSIAVDTEGRVVLGGYGEAYDDQDHQTQPLLVRTAPGGQLDTTFDGAGFFDITLSGSFAIPAIAIDACNDGIVHREHHEYRRVAIRTRRRK